MSDHGPSGRPHPRVEQAHNELDRQPTEPSGEQVRAKMWRQAATYGAVGIEVAACVAGGAIAGHFADGRYTESPWGFFFGTAVGCGAAVKAMVRLVPRGRRR